MEWEQVSRGGTEARGCQVNEITEVIQRRVVCAAIRCQASMVIGVRHHDHIMNDHIWEIDRGGGYWVRSDEEQGFVDQWGVFMDCKEALTVALAANQRIRRCGGDEQQLYSENLY